MSQDPKPVRIGLVGCGGRGTGAAENCLNSAKNVELVALADMFQDRLNRCRKFFADSQHPGYKVEDKYCITGFDAYKRILETDIDLVLFATPPGFRPIHFDAAVEAGKHVFMEKPVAVDPVGVRQILATAKKAAEKKLSVVPGTQYRHQESFIETIRRVHDGAIGAIRAGRIYYNGGELPFQPRRNGETDMEHQIRNWWYYDWLSGDCIVEQHIHTIDVCDWTMGAHPTRATATGGRQQRTDPKYGNIYDHFAIDYEYPGGVHVMSFNRQMKNTDTVVASFFTGTKGTVSPHDGVITGENAWTFPGLRGAFGDAISKAYVKEHTDLIESIRGGAAVNFAPRIAETTLTAIMGRQAAYTGKTVTWDEMTKSLVDYSPEKYELGPVPTRPVPQPGKA